MCAYIKNDIHKISGPHLISTTLVLLALCDRRFERRLLLAVSLDRLDGSRILIDVGRVHF